MTDVQFTWYVSIGSATLLQPVVLLFIFFCYTKAELQQLCTRTQQTTNTTAALQTAERGENCTTEDYCCASTCEVRVRPVLYEYVLVPAADGSSSWQRLVARTGMYKYGKKKSEKNVA